MPCVLSSHQQYSAPNLHENMFMYNAVTVVYPKNIPYAVSCFIF